MTTILVTLIVYKLVLLGIGLFAQGRTKSQEDLYLGGRQLGPLVAAISAAATSPISARSASRGQPRAGAAMSRNSAAARTSRVRTSG